MYSLPRGASHDCEKVAIAKPQLAMNIIMIFFNALPQSPQDNIIVDILVCSFPAVHLISLTCIIIDVYHRYKGEGLETRLPRGPIRVSLRFNRGCILGTKK